MTTETVFNWTTSFDEDNSSNSSGNFSLTSTNSNNVTTTSDPMCEMPVNDAFLEFCFYAILLNVVSFFGILGNTISIIVLSRPQMKSSINYLLIGLATCDTILILLSVLIYGLAGIYAYTGYLFHYKFFVYPKIVRYLYPMSTTAQMATVYITLTVTMERYVAVCHPLKARSLCTYGRARTALLLIVVISILYNIPKLWEVRLVEEPHCKYNITVYGIGATELRENKLYKTIYVHYLYFFIYYAFPFVALVIFNVAIFKRVRKANRDLRRLSRHQRREIGLATMLLCVVIVFLVCNIVPLFSNVSESMYTNPPIWMIQLGNLLVTFNSGVNFIIYVIFGRKFKRIFLKIFCRVSGETGLDCMGRPSRADSPDFQTNEDSFATNLSNVELRNSIRRFHGSHHHHHHHGSNSLRPGSTHSGGSNGFSRASVYYPMSPKPGFQNNGSSHSQHNHRERSSAANLEDTAFC